MPNRVKPPLFVHLGLERTGTKYLQHTVLPNLERVFVVPRRQYWKMESFIPETNELPIIVSNEFDWELEREIKELAQRFPDARPIFVLRRHDSWLVSQFKRFIKNGGQLSFQEFFDWKNDTGRYAVDDMRFRTKLAWLEHAFPHPPLILFYEDLRTKPNAYLDKLCSHIGAVYPMEKRETRRTHASYTERQLAFLLAIQQSLIGDFVAKRKLLRYFFMFLAKQFPFLAKDKPPIIPNGSKAAIRKLLQDDWEACLAYAEKLGHPPLSQDA